MKSPASENLITDNFSISNIIDYSKLESEFILVKYQLSKSQENYKNFADKKNFYAKFTNSYKETFNLPFYYYSHDKPQSALYSLVPKKTGEPVKWEFNFKEKEEIKYEKISFKDIPPSTLIKILLANFFYNEIDKEKRVCQSSFYLYGKSKGPLMNVAIKVDLLHQYLNPNYNLTEFHIGSKACFLKMESNIKSEYINSTVYYHLITKDGLSYFRQVRPSKVKDSEKTLFREYSNINSKYGKAHLDWYRDRKHKENKSYLIYSFKKRFIEYIESYGIKIVNPTKNFIKHKIQGKNNLPLDTLETIYIYDNRLNKENVKAKEYIELMNEIEDFEDLNLNFEYIEENDLSKGKPIIILQDYNVEDFIKDENESNSGCLAKFEDPYKILYSKYPEISKQSINVNSNNGEDYNNSEQYLKYSLPWHFKKLSPKKQSELPDIEKMEYEKWQLFKLKLEVCLNEIFLKDIILNKDGSFISDNFRFLLPLIDKNPEIKTLGFIQSKTLLYFEGNQMKFTDLRNKEGKDILSARFCRWSELKQKYSTRIRLNEDDVEKKLESNELAFIIGKDFISEIEQLPESIIPNFPEIENKKSVDSKTSAKCISDIGPYAGGIWYNEEEKAYIVGGVGGSKGTEPRALHIYKVHFYNSDAQLNFKHILNLMSVKFVRKNQFTVYPYFFDLIRLYREITNQLVILNS